MRKAIVILFVFLSSITYAQKAYWQQTVHYIIDATLNDKEKTIDAFEKITYINNSPDTLHFIWFHLWSNAYKNDRTAFSEQMLENGNTAFYFSSKEQKGYTNRMDFKVDGVAAKTEDHPQYIDIVKLVLPKPLPPGAQAVITTPFHVKLPFNFSRGGYDGETFQVTQWYPKPAVYDQKGWHPMPYLDQGEFYSEFGSFDVRITLPENYVVAATGELQNAEEKEWLKTRKWVATVTTKKPPAKNAGKQSKSKKLVEPVATKTLHYLQDNVHDFAWFANKDFIVDYDTCRLQSRVVDVYTFYTAAQHAHWKASIKYAKDALGFYSKEIGEYPYSIASVVQGPASFGGGMEYPTITIISPIKNDRELDLTVAHELGHNWFYGILGSNERQYPWMDEGLNTFYENKYAFEKYGPQVKAAQIMLVTKEIRKTDQSINTSSDQYSATNYGLVAYNKTADWMQLLEQKMGKESLRQSMHDYFNQWRFKHPMPEDFKAVFNTSLKEETEKAFALLDTTGVLPNEAYKGFTLTSPLKPSGLKEYLVHPTKNMILLSPAIGYNAYDQLMVGAFVTNYKLPPNNFQFFLSGLYGTGSNRLNGIGKLNFNFYPKRIFRLGQLFVNGSSFSMDEFKDTADRKLNMAFEKLVPGIRLTFKEKNPRSTVRKYLQWKTFLINEQGLRIRQDTVVTGIDTALVLRYNKIKQSQTIHQLQFVIENTRALYPYNVKLEVESSADFIRPTLDVNYFFNYAKGGGLSVRFFAGKFIYTGEKTLSRQFATDRYHLNMTGANGYEDYTYSDYFAGRNKFEGFASQQIMIRDGGFKVRTDLLAAKVGKTDDWLMALNLNSTVPDNSNPLSVLPVKIPLHVFVDIGTYAEGWKRNSETDRFLFDAGLHIPLLHETFNIYIPVLYSRIYGDYFKSTIPENRFFKTISFTINFNNSLVKKLNHEAEF